MVEENKEVLFMLHNASKSFLRPVSMKYRNFDEILADCVAAIEGSYYRRERDGEDDYNELALRIENLAAELALCPETYYAISELFGAGSRRNHEVDSNDGNRLNATGEYQQSLEDLEGEGGGSAEQTKNNAQFPPDIMQYLSTSGQSSTLKKKY